MSLTTPFAAVTIGSRVVIVSSFAPSGCPPVGRIDRTRRPRWSRLPSGAGLGDALQDQVGKIETQLDRILVAE